MTVEREVAVERAVTVELEVTVAVEDAPRLLVNGARSHLSSASFSGHPGISGGADGAEGVAELWVMPAVEPLNGGASPRHGSRRRLASYQESSAVRAASAGRPSV